MPKIKICLDNNYFIAVDAIKYKIETLDKNKIKRKNACT